MSGLRNRATAALLSFLVLPAGLAAAQTAPDGEAVGPPVVLTPPSPGGAAEPTPLPDTVSPVPETPAPASPDAAPTESAPAVERAPSGIEVDRLEAVATDYAGTLDAAAGGLPAGMWRGTDRALVERLLPALPVVPQSPALRDLARRLLLSSAEAPSGPATLDMMIVRAERLIALGDRRGAAELLAMIPQGQVDAGAARLRLEASWLAGDDERACAEIPGLVSRFGGDPYFQKALIFCQAKAGQTDEAILGLDLLREQGHQDPAFFQLVEVLTGLEKSAEIDTLGEPRGLTLAMLRAGGQEPPEASDPRDPQLVMLRLAEAEGDDLLAATEQAVGLGLVAPAELARLYRETAATPEDIAAAGQSAPDSPHARAVLYQAAEQATAPGERARLIARALAAAPHDGSHGVAVRTYLPLIVELLPVPENVAAAEEIGRALYLAGRYELATAWRDLARAEAARNADAATAVPALMLLSKIAGSTEPLAWDAGSIAAWRQAQSSAGDADLRAARLFAVLDGLGQPVGEAWRALADPAAPMAAELSYPALWFALGDAAAGGRIGETVMLALFLLGPDGPGEAHPVELGRALAALRQAGLEAEARAIAFEAALANGA